MATIYVGTSQLPGRTFLKPQLMERGAGLQVIGLLNLFFQEHGYRLTINEAIRSQEDQKLLRTAWETFLKFGTPFAVLAAALYLSTHDPSRGGAIDFGGPGGRVLTQAEHDWLVVNGPRYGIRWTGKGFTPREWWHFNAVRSSATVVVPDGTPILDAAPAAALVHDLGDIMANSSAYTIYNHPTQARHFIAGAGRYRAFGDAFKQETGIDPQTIIDKLKADGVESKNVADDLTYAQLNVTYASIANEKAA